MTAEICERRLRRRVEITRPYRIKIVFTPQWEGPIRNWAYKFVSKNRWRCDAIHEFDDLIQDAYLCFVKVSDRYPLVIIPQQFMALFRTTFTNQMHDHSRYVKRKRVVHCDSSKGVSELCVEFTRRDYNGGYLGALLAGASDNIKRAITLIVEDDPALHTKLPNHHRDNLDKRVSRILGVEGFKFTDELKTLLSH